MPEKMLRLAYATNNVPGIKYASQKIRNASYWFDVPPEIKDLVLKSL